MAADTRLPDINTAEEGSNKFRTALPEGATLLPGTLN